MLAARHYGLQHWLSVSTTVREALSLWPQHSAFSGSFHCLGNLKKIKYILKKYIRKSLTVCIFQKKINKMRMAVHFHWLESFLSSLLYRFCAGYWTCDLLQDWALHTPVILLLFGHSCLLAGHFGCCHAHLEHFTSPWWRTSTSSYIYKTISPTFRQWLCGVALLSYVTSQAQSLRKKLEEDCQLYMFWSSKEPASYLQCNSQEKRIFQ